MTTNLSTKTAVAIDTELARIWAEKARYAAWIGNLRSILHQEATRGNAYRHADYERLIGEYTDKYAALDAEGAPYEAEYRRRGGWNRYFLVKNSNGHVHRGMNCTTCYHDTQYAWLVDLADCDEGQMITDYGEMACTVCFPNAPTNPAFNGPGRLSADNKAQRDAEKAARAAAKAAKMLNDGDTFRDLSNWLVTTVAGAKTALREVAAARVAAATSDYYAEKARVAAPAVETAARAALAAKGVTDDEMDTIMERATTKARKEWQ